MSSSDFEQIDQRDRLRAEAKLPPLSVANEIAKMKDVHEAAEFEKEFERRRPELVHLWNIEGAGFFTRYGLYTSVRNQLRDEWQSQRTQT